MGGFLLIDGLAPEALDRLPRLGWVAGPTPVTPLPALAQQQKLGWLGIRRDDQCEFFPGGTKVRKLDFLLAQEPFADAPAWASVGAIGSGHLVACTAAATKLHRQLHASIFWEPVSEGVLENLAFTTVGPTKLTYFRSRVTVALRRPQVWLGRRVEGLPCIPPGATCAVGMLGLVRAGLELAEQVRAGELPEPQRLYVALGSGGTAAGLAVGLALGGLETMIHAVAVVERPLSTRHRLAGLIRSVQNCLQQAGLPGGEGIDPVRRVAIDRSQLGPGYGRTSREALEACELLARHGVALEPIYTGKAMAALLVDARKGGAATVLFWHTPRRALPPTPDSWREKLPPALARRLLLTPEARRRITRRRFLLGGAAAGAGLLLFGRLTGYPELSDWQGRVLSVWQAHVVMAAAEALLPPLPQEQGFRSVAARVDQFLVGMPPESLRQVDQLLVLIEHGTTPLGLRLWRFTRLSPMEREAYLAGLASKGGLLAQAYRGIRDLCMIGYYQQETSWAALRYEGPWISGARPRGARYAALVAPEGALPRGRLP